MHKAIREKVCSECSLPVHRPDLINRNRWLPALVGSVRLCSLYASLLALSDKASFKFSNHPENGQQDRTGDICRREVRRKKLQNRPSLLKIVDEVQNVPGVPSQSVEPQDHKLVALSNKLQDRREFVST
jgi:hypothetical protein